VRSVAGLVVLGKYQTIFDVMKRRAVDRSELAHIARMQRGKLDHHDIAFNLYQPPL
jgi:hypothetical protein